MKRLPKDGMISASQFAKFLGTRNDVLRKKLREKGVPTLNLSTFGGLQLIFLKDLRDHLKWSLIDSYII